MASYTIDGEVLGDAAGINNVRGRVVSQVSSTGTVTGSGSVTGYVTVTVAGLVGGAAVVSGAVRNTPRVFGEVDGSAAIAGAVRATAKFPQVVSGTASITGVPQRSLVGTVTGTGSVTGTVRPGLSITGLVRGFQSVTGALRGAKTVTGAVTGAGSVTDAALRLGIRVAGSVSRPSALTVGYIIHAKVTSPVVLGAGGVVGAVVRAQPPVGSAEGGYEATGVRPGLPLLVYDLDAYVAADVAAVPAGGSFLVSPAYVGAPGDPFFEAGAGADSIGTKIQPAVGSAFYVFRSPLADEVVWYVGGEQTYRYHLDRGTGVSRWGKYRTPPQRTADGMYVFSIFDPDGIYTYYAKLMGAVQYQLSYDNQVLLQQFDPDLVSRFYISELATNYGLVLDDTDTLAVKRAKTRNAVSVAKLKGLGEAVSIRLRALGYSGYANEIWVNPTNGANFQSAAHNDDGSPTSTATGAGTDYVEFPHGYRTDDPEDGYFPSSRISLHVLTAAGGPLDVTPELMDRIATELGRDVLPVHVDIRCFATDFSVGGASDGVEGIAVGETLTNHDVASSDTPVVYAGADFTQHEPTDAYTIGDSTATDPGSLPLTYVWSVVSGPGGSTFDDATLLHPTITFHGGLGTYVLRLTATNGLASAHDDVTVVAAAAQTTFIAIGGFINTLSGDRNVAYTQVPDGRSSWGLLTGIFGSGQQVSAGNYINGHWFLGSTVGAGPDAVISADGVTWTPITPLVTSGEYINAFDYFLGMYFVSGAFGHYATSTDGISWTQRTSPVAANCRWMAFDGTTIVVVGEQAGNDTRFYYSTDGIAWTAASTDAGTTAFGIPKVKYANGTFMAVGFTGGGPTTVWIFTSPDGHSWTRRVVGFTSTDGLDALAYGNGVWVVAGPQTGGTFYTSSDNGVNWTSHASGISITGVYDITFSGGRFYAVGSDGKVYTSTDGATWDSGANLGRSGNPTGRIIAGP